MSTLSNYKKEAKKLFILSVKKDIDKWSKGTDAYFSPNYNYSYFIVIRYDFFNLLRISNKTASENICLINWLFIPFNFKIFYYYLKIKKHFRRVERDKKVSENINNIKSSLEDMKPEFIQQIRKEKLESLK